jgi:hypothetical protein
VRIFLKQEKKLYVLENLVPNAPAKDAEEEVKNEYQSHVDDDEQAAYVMLASMSPELQRQRENMDAHAMIMHLKELFEWTNKTKRYEYSKELFYCKMLFCCKMTKGSSVNTHVLKMIGYIEKLG